MHRPHLTDITADSTAIRSPSVSASTRSCVTTTLGTSMIAGTDAFLPHRIPQREIERPAVIEQDQLRVPRQGARQGHALPLATAKPSEPVSHSVEMDGAQERGRDRAAALSLRPFRIECSADGEVWKEAVVLRNVGEPTLLWWPVDSG